jgi:hypothetical protein
MTIKIPKRISTAVLQSLGAGVVPRVGIEYVAVGRKEEITAILNDLDQIVAEGGASFRLILGRYGSGKSFLCQLIRNYALQKNFVVADADLSPDRRLTGTKGQGLALYRELLNNLATRTRPDGNAFAALLERWINDIQNQVIQQENLRPTDTGFNQAVEQRIHATINAMEGLVHGFDFANVIHAYWQGHQANDEPRKDAALRWLRGEYSLKSEAQAALGVRVIIDDDTWYDYIKILAHFMKDVGYQGLVLFVDEAVNLYKISNKIARQNNYERLLSIFNDILQGKASHLGLLMGATPQMVEDPQRGLFSYEALRTRLEESRFARNGLRDLTGPLVRLEVLSQTEIFVLLQRLRELHGIHYEYTPTVTDADIQLFMTEVYSRIGADQLLTPREVTRDFVTLLNLLHQNPNQSIAALLHGPSFQPSQPTADPETIRPEALVDNEEEGEGGATKDEDPSPYTSFKL